MNTDFLDYFFILEIHMMASDAAIKSAYRRLCALYHPDNEGDREKYELIQEAYLMLKDKRKRQEYLKKWKEHYFLANHLFAETVSIHINDAAFNTVREALNVYMNAIINREYDKAYHLLSYHNRQYIYKHSFIEWQEMISEVHQLLRFQSAIDTFHTNIERESHVSIYIVTFKVKVTELNLILNKVESDTFQRDVIYEKNNWKILLPDIDVKNIIKKYRRILVINKKNKRKFLKTSMDSSKEFFSSKLLTKDAFINNVEYEFIRYMRYKRLFSLIKIKWDCVGNKQNIHVIIDRIMERNTRKIDSYSLFKAQVILLLLPETNQDGTKTVSAKLKKAINEWEMDVDYWIYTLTIDKSFISSKMMLNQLLQLEENEAK